jgi:membrane associated rhomboid family serine protease
VAFLRQDTPREPFLRAPAVVVGLIAVLAGAHALRVFGFPGSGDSWFISYGFVPARYSASYLAARGANPGSVVQQALPFVTYLFLHANWTHLAVNCVWLLAFGPVVARRQGAMVFVLFFLVCGIAGAAAHLALNWADPQPLIGASAGISGLMAAAFRMSFLGPSDEVSRPLAPIFSSRIMLWTAIWAGVNIVVGKLGIGTGGGGDLVAWQAHLGGYAAGLLLAGPFDSLAKLTGRNPRAA